MRRLRVSVLPRGLALVLLATVGVALAGCRGAERREGPFRVLATTSIIGEAAREVVGPDAEVRVLIPAGADLHSFELDPTAARDISDADLIFVNGYGLEESVLKVVVENARKRGSIVPVSRGLTPIATDGDPDHAADTTPARGVDALVYAEGDPHLWLAVPNYIAYVETIRDAMSAADPDHAAGYGSRATAYIERLRALDVEVRSELGRIPPERRQLVVFHDAYAYLAREYGLTLLATVLPTNPNQQASASAIAQIVRTVREQRIPTVYREPQFAADALDVIARESGANVGILTDSPTPAFTTYEAVMRANARALVDGLR